MRKSEKDIEKALVKMIRRQGGDCLKFVSPGNTGVPDRVCIVPGIPPFFVELKREDGGVLSEKQIYWASRLQSLGAGAYIIHTEAQIDALELDLIGRKGKR
mgnify:CR=1 FL=1